MVIQRTVVFFGGSLDFHWVFWWFFKDSLRFLLIVGHPLGFLVVLCTFVEFFGGSLDIRWVFGGFFKHSLSLFGGTLDLHWVF